MYKCPACGADEVMGLARCRCGADLTLLLTLDAVADAWFNRGLSALGRDAPGEALEWFSACCAAKPGDGQARLAHAKTWARLGCFAEAAQSLEKAKMLGVDGGEVQKVEAGIREMTSEPGDKSAESGDV